MKASKEGINCETWPEIELAPDDGPHAGYSLVDHDCE